LVSEFQENYEYFQTILTDYQKILESVRSGNPKAMEKHLERGKIPARQRIRMILDPDTPFMELSPLAAYNLYDNAAPYAGIVTGIGFLGAGALIRTTDKIFGFTTAASIWLFAILGLIIGLGQYRIGLNLYVIIWMVVLCDNILAKKGIGSYQQKIVVSTNKIIDEGEIIKVLKENGVKKYKLMNLEINKKKGGISSTFLIDGSKEKIKKIHKALLTVEWFESCHIG